MQQLAASANPKPVFANQECGRRVETKKRLTYIKLTRVLFGCYSKFLAAIISQFVGENGPFEIAPNTGDGDLHRAVIEAFYDVESILPAIYGHVEISQFDLFHIVKIEINCADLSIFIILVNNSFSIADHLSFALY